MAKRAKPTDATKSNGYNGEALAGYIRKIESLFADMASEQGAYMRRCQDIRGSIGVVYTEAKALGIPQKVLKAHVDLRKLEEKKLALVEAFEGEDAETFEQIAEALGDFAALPLGFAAVEKARAGDGRGADALGKILN